VNQVCELLLTLLVKTVYVSALVKLMIQFRPLLWTAKGDCKASFASDESANFFCALVFYDS